MRVTETKAKEQTGIDGLQKNEGFSVRTLDHLFHPTGSQCPPFFPILLNILPTLSAVDKHNGMLEASSLEFSVLQATLSYIRKRQCREERARNAMCNS